MNIHEINECKFTNIYGSAHVLSALLTSMSSKGLDRPLHSCRHTQGMDVDKGSD